MDSHAIKTIDAFLNWKKELKYIYIYIGIDCDNAFPEWKKN